MKFASGDQVVIVFTPDWANQMAAAAAELKRHLALVDVEAELALAWVPDRRNILLGRGWDDQADRDSIELSKDGILMRALDEDRLLLSGSSVRGALNAVYVFLEEHMGFVWLNVKETHVPPARRWDLSGLNISYDPPLELRNISTAAAMDDAWSARNRLNFFTDRSIPEDPRLMDGCIFAGKHCHNVFKLLSLGYFGTRENPLTPYEDSDLIKELYAIHPEYFALVGGCRDPYPCNDERADLSEQEGNISLTNRAVWDLLVKGGRLLLDYHPRARIISLSLRDNYHYCEEALNSPGGVGASLIRLVNYFAVEIETSHPHVNIDFLAYHGTQRPPENGRFHRTVTVRYCPIRVSQYHAFDESDHNLIGGLNFETPPSMAQPIRQLSQWNAVASRVVVWYYALSLPYFHPQPGLRSHGRTFRLLQDQGVKGVYVQDNMPMSENCFNDLRAYILTKLLWNPSFDEQKGIQKFCEIYYQTAAPWIREYIVLLHDEEMWDWKNWIGLDGTSKWESDDREASWGWFGDEPVGQFPAPHFYTLYHSRPPLKSEFFRKGWSLLLAAADAAQEDRVVTRRLEETWLSFYYGVLCYPPGMAHLEAEARAWFEPRFESLRQKYAAKEFHGLGPLGLRWPVARSRADQGDATPELLESARSIF